METPRNVPQIFAFSYSLPCDIYGCYKPAKWQIGRPDGPLGINHRLCDECARALVTNVPEELLPLPSEPDATSAENGEAFVCACGRTFEGVTAKATFVRHQKGCAAAHSEAQAEMVQAPKEVS